MINVGSLFKDLKKNNETQDLRDLKIQATTVSAKEKLNELSAHGTYSKNLAYDLPYQRNGALSLMRDHNATALLADEVGLGKTITTGMVIKEGVYRGFFKKIVVLAPPSFGYSMARGTSR